MFLPRNKAVNDLRGQNGRVNYALRRRIYDTDRLKYELEWRKLNVRKIKYLYMLFFNHKHN